MKKILLTLFLFSCSAGYHNNQVTNDQNLSVANVQKEIRVGMSGAEVTQALGSPNMITTDENRREVWVYDKISTTNAYSESSTGILSLILHKSSGASSNSQKTLTVIIKFDDNKKVRDFAYNTTRF